MIVLGKVISSKMYIFEHGVKRSRFWKCTQKWIHTPLQNYQMYEFIQKWVFHWIFIRIRIATSVTFGRKWKNLIPQNNYKKCHVLHWFLMEFLNDYSTNILQIRLFHWFPCKNSWNLSTISHNKNQLRAEL